MTKAEINNGALRYDTMQAEEIRDHFEPSFYRRSFNPLEDPFASANLQDQVALWRAEGKTIVFTSGVYDLFHANHRTYLLHTKTAAAPFVWDKATGWEEGPWDEQSGEQKREFITGLLEQDSLRLVVSVDGNMAVAARKGFNPAKGNSVRPIYDWKTRARDVLSAAHELPSGQARFIADAVTIHDNVQPEFADTPHAGILDIAAHVNPDVWSVFCESQDIIEAVQTTHASRFKGVGITVLEAMDFYHDRLMGSTFGTTEVVRRIGGSAAQGAQA